MLCHNKSLYIEHSLQEPYKESTQVILLQSIQVRIASNYGPAEVNICAAVSSAASVYAELYE